MKTLKDKEKEFIKEINREFLVFNVEDDLRNFVLNQFEDYKEDVKDAVLEDIEDLQNLIHSITFEDDIFDIKKKLNLHLKFKKRRF